MASPSTSRREPVRVSHDLHCQEEREPPGGSPLRRRPLLHRGDRDPQGEVRSGQEYVAHQGGPRALLLRRHPAHALRLQRPHQRPCHHAGARRARMLPQGQGHQNHAHGRLGRSQRQDHRSLRQRPRVQALERHQEAAVAPPR